jgi:hypothetical protein
MPQRDALTTKVLTSLARRILVPVCLLVPAAATAEEPPQHLRLAQAADHAKDKPDLCPKRWGKRPRRANGPGAERYVAEWGPCKPVAAVPAALAPAVQPPPTR